jgi:hypothetical protein
MEQPTDSTYFLSPRGERTVPFTLEQLRALALRRMTSVGNDIHWAWRPVGRMAQFFGPASRVVVRPPSLWRWLARVRDQVVRALQPRQGTELVP